MNPSVLSKNLNLIESYLNKQENRIKNVAKVYPSDAEGEELLNLKFGDSFLKKNGEIDKHLLALNKGLLVGKDLLQLWNTKDTQKNLFVEVNDKKVIHALMGLFLLFQKENVLDVPRLLECMSKLSLEELKAAYKFTS